MTLNSKQSVSIALILALTSVATADDAISTSWTCSRCPVALGWELDIEGGPAYLADDEYVFGDYTGLDSKGLYIFGDVLGQYRGEDATYVTLEGYARGLDSAALFVEGGKQGTYEVRASYQSIPRRTLSSTVTPFEGVGGDSLTLPTTWVAAPTTMLMTDLGSSARPVAIGWDWDILGLGVDYKLSSRWKLSADYTRRAKQGQSRSSASFWFSAVELPSPIDYTTDDIEFAAAYSADTWQVSAIYFGSAFRNSNSGLSWENPYSTPAGVASGRLALVPDNTSHQLSIAGAMRLPARTTLNGQFSIGRMSQDATLLPYTINPGIATTPLPVNYAGAKADTTHLNLRITSSPWRRFSVEGGFRYQEFDNRTTVNTFDYVVTDSTPAFAPVANTTYSYDRREFTFRVEYRLQGSLKLYAGYDGRRYKRTQQDRNETDTHKLWFRARMPIGDISDLTLEVFGDDREGSSFEVISNLASQQNPLMRKYNLADRQRYGVRAFGSVYATERMDIGWELEYGADDYNNSAIGLTESDFVRGGLDVSYLLAGSASVYASVYREDIETTQQNSQSFSLPDWVANTDDRFTTATFGLNYPGMFDLLDATLDYSWSDSVGKTVNNTSGLPSSFPELTTNRQTMILGLTYPASDKLSFRLDYIYENFRSNDWALDGVGVDTIPNLLSFGADAWNYTASVVYFSARYQTF